MKLTILGLISSLIILGIAMAGVIFTGNPGGCGAGDVDKAEVLPVLNKVNRLIAGEVKSISLTDDELTAIFMERLDPRVKNFRICLGEDRVGLSGQTTNRLGLTVKFNVLARVGFGGNYPQISGLELAVGRIVWPSGYIQKLVNQRLASFNFGRKFKIDVNPGVVILENYE